MERFSCGVQAAAPSAVFVDEALCLLWNPSVTIALYVLELSAFASIAGVGNLALLRATTTGTTSASTTPGANNHFRRAFIPPSACIIYTDWTVQPTFAGPYLSRLGSYPNVLGVGVATRFVGTIAVPPGTGLCLVSPIQAGAPVWDVTVMWEE